MALQKHRFVAGVKGLPDFLDLLAAQSSTAAVRRPELQNRRRPIRNEKASEILPASMLEAVVERSAQDPSR